ncbi:hypothetical protein LOTGIDRAFT_228589 [Lottia gigantea]|uniref:OCIA domain-containing protein n=1 Tax=Lottia gigantea TaxID=225164 RepID=V4BXJ7_LOTGI|nr:hypothetical protein LOTGIDRAFT_228589 [Lottia gigantea]ESO93824.1 hypothetical protein LOTGIDRAFT_228589 [Lottia gigantea]
MAQAESAKTLKIELTKEDKVLIKECYKESLYYRSLPLVTINSVGTYALHKRGLIKRPFLTYSFGAIIGIFVGVASYGPACRKKFAAKVPTSDFSRLYTGKISPQDLVEEQRQSRRVHQDRQDEEPVSYLKELGHGEAQLTNEEIVEGGNKKITYEETKNRAQLQPQQPPPRYQSQDDQWNNEDGPRSPQTPKSFIDKRDAKRNKYGDVMD